MYNHVYQLTHDMDCFFVLNGTPVHIATNGGIVPSSLGTVSEMQANQTQVAQMGRRFNFSLNKEFLSTLDAGEFPSREDILSLDLKTRSFEELFENSEYQDIPFHWKVYSHSFAEMATKGFWSFDRTGELRVDFDYYTLIAWPTDANAENKTLLGPRFEIPCCREWYKRPYLEGIELFGPLEMMK